MAEAPQRPSRSLSQLLSSPQRLGTASSFAGEGLLVYGSTGRQGLLTLHIPAASVINKLELFIKDLSKVLVRRLSESFEKPGFDIIHGHMDLIKHSLLVYAWDINRHLYVC